jgi:hypothetical protein
VSEIKAIPTYYKGIRFRSRLEAKWAATFDAMQFTWEYEPLDLNGWIPDFLIIGTRQPHLVEIKPVLAIADAREAQIKIERALGAPLPHELRQGRPSPTFEEWDKWYDSLKYTLWIQGLKPLKRGVDIERDKPADGEFCIGWCMTKHRGWVPSPSNIATDRLLRAWREGSNAVQWKAPA